MNAIQAEHAEARNFYERVHVARSIPASPYISRN